MADGTQVLKKDVFEIGARFMTMGGDPEEIIKSAEVVNGIPINNLDCEIKFKKALGREKDFRDIELIQEYISKHK